MSLPLRLALLALAHFHRNGWPTSPEYALIRKNQVERAIKMGRRGVQLQPDLVQAHYFLGLAYFAASERDAANYQDAARHLLDAVRTGPQWQPTWFVLSYTALLTGNYKRAEEYASRLLEMSLAPKGLPFIGAEIVLGSVKLRQGDPGGARAVLLDFLGRMTGSAINGRSVRRAKGLQRKPSTSIRSPRTLLQAPRTKTPSGETFRPCCPSSSSIMVRASPPAKS